MKVAYYWEGEPEGERRAITYADLLRDVSRFANGLKSLGVTKGTPVAIYMGMVPELAVAMLGCARIGAPHMVVFGGFSADSLAARINDMRCEVLITQDEAWRRGSAVPLKRIADEALSSTETIRDVVVLTRTGGEINMRDRRDHRWRSSSTASTMSVRASRWTARICCSSCTRAGRPPSRRNHPYDRRLPRRLRLDAPLHLRPEAGEGCVLVRRRHRLDHRAQLHRVRPALQRRHVGDVRVYAGLPGEGHWWSIVERYGATILYTAPTAIRSHMKWGPQYAQQHDLSSLRLLGSVGGPIDPGGVVLVPGAQARTAPRSSTRGGRRRPAWC